VRRRRFEIDLGRLLCPGQLWLENTADRVWAVSQIHRLDCEVELRCGSDRRLVRFEQLRAEWQQITNPRLKEAA
jgi:hypothetical protein